MKTIFKNANREQMEMMVSRKALRVFLIPREKSN